MGRKSGRCRIKDVSPRTETWYKADGMGELAPHSEASGSVPDPAAAGTELCIGTTCSYPGRPRLIAPVGFNLPVKLEQSSQQCGGEDVARSQQPVPP